MVATEQTPNIFQTKTFRFLLDSRNHTKQTHVSWECIRDNKRKNLYFNVQCVTQNQTPHEENILYSLHLMTSSSSLGCSFSLSLSPLLHNDSSPRCYSSKSYFLSWILMKLWLHHCLLQDHGGIMSFLLRSFDCQF